MKKLVLLCLLFIFSGTFYAQDTKAKSNPAKKETTKKKSGYDYDKDVPVKSSKKETTSKSSATKEKTKKESATKSSSTKETSKKETDKKKSGYDYNKDVSVKSNKNEAKSKSSYDFDKKTNKSEANKIDAKIKDEKYTKGNSKKKPTYKETNEKAPKTPDRVTGTYNGKKVYTGSRGGKYYINKNGNKTYIQD